MKKDFLLYGPCKNIQAFHWAAKFEFLMNNDHMVWFVNFLILDII